jgi:hypothetical protein
MQETTILFILTVLSTSLTGTMLFDNIFPDVKAQGAFSQNTTNREENQDLVTLGTVPNSVYVKECGIKDSPDLNMTEHYNNLLKVEEIRSSFGVEAPYDIQEMIDCIEKTNNGSDEISQPQSTIKYTPYTNERMGISLEYPSTWTLDEKENRFDTGAEATISDGLNMFKVMFRDDSMNEFIDTLGFEYVAESLEDSIAGPSDLIEPIDLDKYSIDGKETATFLYLAHTDFGIELPSQAFIVNDDGSLMTFGYQNTKSNFDTQESQDVMNHIINSIKFLNSDSRISGSENDNEEENNDESNNDNND